MTNTGDYYDLGTYTRTVSTRSAEAQRWFDRGLVWCYAFNHEEAVRCFRRATGHDPGCAMAWWGIGYAAGPYYNKPWSKFDPLDLKATLREVRAATREALGCIGNVEPVERALVEALARRYPHRSRTATSTGGTTATLMRCGRRTGRSRATRTCVRCSPRPS